MYVESHEKPVKILIVDDEPKMADVVKQTFREQVKQGVYFLDSALNGKEALEKFEQGKTFDIILLDINMPVMDGLAFLKKFIRLNLVLTKIIIISAYGDMENIRSAMNLGAFDFLIKTVDKDDLRKTVEKAVNFDVNYIKGLLRDSKAHSTLVREIKKMSCPDFRLRKSGVDIYGKSVQIDELGGDFYDVFTIDAYRLGVLVGDISGHGLPAFPYLLYFREIFLANALKGVHADSCLKNVNLEIIDKFPSNRFVTAFYGILDLRNGTFEYARAGHQLPLLISDGTKVSRLEKVFGTALGSRKEKDFELNIISIKPGETLFMYTDGITDAGKNQEQMLGEEGLITILEQNAALKVEQLVNCVLEKANDCSCGERDDDRTCLALRYMGSNNGQ